MILALAAVLVATDVPCGCADRWVDRLSDPSPAVREVARVFTRELGEEACVAVPALIGELDARTEPEELEHLIHALGSVMGPEKPVEIVTRLLEIAGDAEAEEGLRNAAAWELTRDPATLDVLRAELESEDENLRRIMQAGFARKMAGDAERGRWLLQAITEDPGLAVFVALRLEPDAVLDLARALYSSPDAEVRASALWALANLVRRLPLSDTVRLEFAQVEPFLRRGLGDIDPDVRYEAAATLLALGVELPGVRIPRKCGYPRFTDDLEADLTDPSARRLVESALTDDCPRNRETAARLLADAGE